LDGVHKFRPGLQTGPLQERGESEIDHELQSRLRDAAEGWPHGARPPKNESRDQRADTDAKRELDVTHRDERESDQSPGQNSESHGRKLGRAARGQWIANFTSNALDRALRSNQLQHISTVEYGCRTKGDLLPGSSQRAQADIAKVKLLRHGEVAERGTAHSLASDGHMQYCNWKVQQLGIVYLRSEPRSHGQEALDPARYNDHVAELQHRVRLHLQDAGSAMDPFDKIAQALAVMLDLRNRFAKESRVSQTIGAHGELVIGRIYAGGLFLDPILCVQRLGFLPQVYSQQLRRDAAHEPDHAEGAEHIG